MPSSKGKPTDPKLREEIKEKVQNETNKDGSGKGQWSAWKAQKMSKEYEKEGGGYENVAGSKNEPAKGPPEPKTDEAKEDEVKKDVDEKKETKEKPKANSGKKATGKKGDAKAKTSKEKKVPATGTRKSTRIGTKRSAPEEEKELEEEQEEEEEEVVVKEKPAAKKTKTAKK